MFRISKDIGRRWCKEGQALVDEIKDTKLPSGEIAFWYMGQLGVIIKSCDVTIGVDLVLNDLIEDGASVRFYPAPFEPDALKLDYVLCSHGHGDHMAIPTLQGLAKANPELRIIVPKGCADTLSAAGISNEQICGVNAGEKREFSGMTLRTVQAAHPVHEVDAQGNDISLSFHISVDGASVLHTGDSYLTDQLYADYMALPTPDIYISPINGGDYFRDRWECIGNFNFPEVIHLFKAVGASLLVPMHFDMIYGNTLDPLPFIRQLWDVVPDARFALPALGERILYRR